MIKKEFYEEVIDPPRLMPFRERMIEQILQSKKNDGQKGKKKYNELSKEIIDLEKEICEKIKVFIDSAERLNIHPKNLLIPNIHYHLSFFAFSDLEVKPKYDEIYLEDENDPLIAISNFGEYIEQDFLDKLIRKWYLENSKQYPNNTDEVEFFYDLNFHNAVFYGQKNLIMSKEIDKIKFYSKSVCSPKIFEFRTKGESNYDKFEELKHNIIAFYESSTTTQDVLSEEQEFSNRGDILMDRKNPYGIVYKINGEEVYECWTVHFWEFYDEFLLLQAQKPELFDKGFKPILETLYSIFLNKYPSNKEYWGSYEEFTLKITQQYFYISNDKKALRLDLYRNVLNVGEFQGGLWHAFQHFKFQGKPMSAINKGGGEFYESDFFDNLKESFFLKEWEKSGKSWVVYIPCLQKTNKKYKFAFFENLSVNGFYSLNSIHYIDRK